ncbi:MAG: sugar phosphate isomerase/epimerase family protein [Planctomycetota bacterium]|jgi:sugar phosphate isomerase/epimerase
MDISISTTTFKSAAGAVPFEEGLEMVREAGFKNIEISRKHTNITESKELIDSLGLKVWSVHGTLGGGAISFSEKERQECIAEESRRMDDTIIYAPCPYVIHYLDRYNDPKYGKVFRKTIEDLHEKAIETGFSLAIETAPYKPKKNERYPDSKEIADFVHSFDSPNVSLCIDLNHSNLNEDLIQVCENCSGIISNIHTSDNHGEWEDHLPPGEGIIDFPAVFRALKKAGYKGPCNIECHLEEVMTLQMLKNIYCGVSEILESV